MSTSKVSEARLLEITAGAIEWGDEKTRMAREILAARRVVEAARVAMMSWPLSEVGAAYESIRLALAAYDAAQPPAGETESKAGGADAPKVTTRDAVLAAASTTPSPPAPSPTAAQTESAEERAVAMMSRIAGENGWVRLPLHPAGEAVEAGRLAYLASEIRGAEQAASLRGKEQERQRWLAHVATRDAAVAAAEALCARLRAEMDRAAQPARGEAGARMGLCAALVGWKDDDTDTAELVAFLAAWLDARKP